MDRHEQLSAEDITPIARRLGFSEEVALVTGAASGIGRVVGFAFGAAGAEVVLVDKDGDGLRSTEESFNEAFNSDVTSITADVTDPSAIDEAVKRTVENHGRLNVLVNVAGAAVPTSTATSEPEQWQRLIEINLMSVYLCSKAAFPHLNPGGRIVNTASIAGLFGSYLMSHYAAAKAGVINITRSLADEWSSANIRINAVAPGAILTPAVSAFINHGSSEVHDRSTINRAVGSPAEVADAVLFLASPAASFISGETLTVGGVPPTQETILDI